MQKSSLYIDMGDYKATMACYEKQLEMCLELGYKRGRFLAIGNIGYVYYDNGDYEAAMACYDKAIAGHREIGYKFGLTYWLEGKARCLFTQKYFSEAKKCADECIELSTEVSKRDMLFASNVLLAKINWALGHQAQALEQLIEMLTNAKEKSDVAALNYELWHMEEGEGKLERGTHALKLYQELYEQTPKFEYQQRIEVLSR